LWTNSIVSRSPIARTTPALPPGMQIKSSCGQFLKVCVGTRLRPLSLGTGTTDFATMCIADCGNRAMTCCGPVKSSCVNSGKMTKPTLKGDMLGSIRLEAWAEIGWRRGHRARKCAIHAAQRSKSASHSDGFHVVIAFKQSAARKIGAHALDEVRGTDVQT